MRFVLGAVVSQGLGGGYIMWNSALSFVRGQANGDIPSFSYVQFLSLLRPVMQHRMGCFKAFQLTTVRLKQKTRH